MSRDDDDDELPVKPIDVRSAYPASLEGISTLFAKGFTVPPALRMNSVYGKFASSVSEQRPSHRLTSTAIVQCYFVAKWARGFLRVI